MNAKLRAAVKERAEGCCEAGGEWVGDGGELDHFWGRAKVAESVENCWLLCRHCHRQKTDNYPSVAFWAAVFAAHAKFHHYDEQIHRCEVRLEVLNLKFPRGATP